MRLTSRLRRAFPAAVLAILAWAWCWVTAQDLLVRPLKYAAWLLALRATLVATGAAARTRHLRFPWPRWATAACVVLAACALLPDVMLGFDTLAGWDFPVHAWHTHALARLLPSLRGWTHAINMGWPEGDDYALVAYLPAALLHLFSFRLIDVETATALEVAVVTVAPALVAALYLGRGLPALLSVTGAVFVLVDPGMFHQGGLIPLTVAGMWPMRLSMTLCLCAMWAADAFLRAPSTRRLVVVMLAVAAAATSHVAGVTYVAVGLLLWLLARGRGPSAPNAGWWLAAGLPPALACAGWLVFPFFELKDYQAALGEGVDMLTRLSDHVLALDWWSRTYGVELAAGAAGIAWLVRRRHPAGALAMVCCLLGMLWIDQNLVTALVPLKHRELVAKVQWTRYDFFARTTLMFAAGVAVAVAVRWLVARLASSTTRTLPVAFACCTAGLAFAAVHTAWPALYARASLKRARETPPAHRIPYVRGLDAAAAWLSTRTTPDTLVAVDLPLGPQPTGHFAGLVNVRGGFPVAAVHRQGTFIFKVPEEHDGPNTYAELAGAGVTHWLSVGNPVRGAPPMTPLQVFEGDVRLHEFPRMLFDQRLSAPPGVSIESFDDDRVVLTGPAAGFEAALRVRWHPRWIVEAGDGVTLRRGAFMPGSRPVFLHVVVPPGASRVVLRAGPPPGAARGFEVTGYGLGLSAVVLGLARRRLRAPPASARVAAP